MDVIPGVINTLVSLCVAINDKIEAARDCEGDFTALKAYVCGLKAALAPIKKLLHELDVAEALEMLSKDLQGVDALISQYLTLKESWHGRFLLFFKAQSIRSRRQSFSTRLSDHLQLLHFQVSARGLHEQHFVGSPAWQNVSQDATNGSGGYFDQDCESELERQQALEELNKILPEKKPSRPSVDIEAPASTVQNEVDPVAMANLKACATFWITLTLTCIFILNVAAMAADKHGWVRANRLRMGWVTSEFETQLYTINFYNQRVPDGTYIDYYPLSEWSTQLYASASICFALLLVAAIFCILEFLLLCCRCGGMHTCILSFVFGVLQLVFTLCYVAAATMDIRKHAKNYEALYNDHSTLHNIRPAYAWWFSLIVSILWIGLGFVAAYRCQALRFRAA